MKVVAFIPRDSDDDAMIPSVLQRERILDHVEGLGGEVIDWIDDREAALDAVADGKTVARWLDESQTVRLYGVQP